MRVLIIRHGAAVDPHEAEGDGQRWLTTEGRQTMRQVASALAEAGLNCDRVFTSPLVRAVQSAEILAAHRGFEGPLEVWDALAGGSTEVALAPLDRAGAEETVGLVGHEPLVRSMVAQLTGELAMFPFRAGAACFVEWDGSSGVFRWMLDPRTLVKIDSVSQLIEEG